MSSLKAVRSEDQFLCSICLQLFTEPVSTPCGHNFCKTCITQHWDQRAPCRCPLCNKVFNIRPEVYVNTFISEMVSQFKQEAERRSDQVSKPGDVSCDVCSEPKLKALKSCLVCLTSFCETHLEPHLTVSGLKRHQLMEPVENLEDRMCPKHDKPLELFCRTDQTCVCTICILLEHKNHESVSLTEESDQRKSSLQQTQTETQQMVDQRRLKIQEIKLRLELSEESANRETAAGLQAFTDLMQSVQTSRDQFIERLQEKQRQTQKQAQDLFQELEQEICELKKRSTEVTEQLSRSKDHLHFLQNSTSLKPAPALKNWSTVSFEPASFEGTAATALSELKEILNEKFKKLAELKRVQQFAVDITLDPDTAHPGLVLSEDLKQVHHSDVKKDLPDKPQRFSYYVCVLAQQSFSSGRFYFEVQLKGKTKWDLGVAQQSINRKGPITLSPQNGFWTIWLRNRDEYKEYKALDSPPVPLSLKRAPQKVGVFVDYDGGLVSFYDVDTGGLIFSFTGCCFKDKVLPLFSPGLNSENTNSTPLIISTVRTKSGKKVTLSNIH